MSIKNIFGIILVWHELKWCEIHIADSTWLRENMLHENHGYSFRGEAMLTQGWSINHPSPKNYTTYKVKYYLLSIKNKP